MALTPMPAWGTFGFKAPKAVIVSPGEAFSFFNIRLYNGRNESY